jgi:hypothetical protein
VSVNKRKCYFGLISGQNELLCSLPVSILLLKNNQNGLKKRFVGQKNWSKEILPSEKKNVPE